jgi:hypothetical protein
MLLQPQDPPGWPLMQQNRWHHGFNASKTSEIQYCSSRDLILNAEQSPEEPHLEAFQWLKYRITKVVHFAPHYNGIAMHITLATTNAFDAERLE